MPWMTVFLDLPAGPADAAVSFWGRVTGYQLAPAADGEPAALLPPSGDPYLRVRLLPGEAGGCGLRLHVDTGAEALAAGAGPAPGGGAPGGGQRAGGLP